MDDDSCDDGWYSSNMDEWWTFIMDEYNPIDGKFKLCKSIIMSCKFFSWINFQTYFIIYVKVVGCHLWH
jgi:hypothetical protein